MLPVRKFRANYRPACWALLLSLALLGGCCGAVKAGTPAPPAPPAPAPHWLTGEELMSNFNNQTWGGDYVDGRTFIETYAPDGRAIYKEPSIDIVGKWSVSQDTFCNFYQELVGGCYRINQVGENCFEIYQGESVRDDKVIAPYFARTWNMARPKTCMELPSV